MHGATTTAAAAPGRPVSRWWRPVVLLVVAVVVGYGVLPAALGLGDAVDALRGIRPGWLAAGAVLEALSITCYGLYTRALLPASGRPPLRVLVLIDLTTWGAGHVLPGGPAGTAPLRFRLHRAHGVDPSSALLLATVQGSASAVVLHVILWSALLVAIPARGADPLYGLAALVGLTATAALVAAVAAAVRGRERGLRALRAFAARVPAVDVGRIDRRMQAVVAQLGRIGHDRRSLALALLWAALNWLLDAAALGVLLLAFGVVVGVDGLLVGFGLANVLAVLPITPGGLGIVEGVLVPSLGAFGAPTVPALLAVLGWRALSFWLPIPAGLLSYLVVRRPALRRGPRPRSVR